MNAADVVAELEGRYPCLQGPHRAICQTGDTYVDIGFEDPAIGSGVYHDRAVPGVVRPMMPRCRYDSEEAAAQDFLTAFALYEAATRLRYRLRAGAEGAFFLYWRYDAPHCFWYQEDRALKCRLVLSANKVVDIGDHDYDAARRAELAHDICGETNVGK